MRLARSLAAFMSGIALVASAQSAQPDPAPLAPRAAVIVAPEAYASDATLGNGCWARLYQRENYSGTVLTLIGPVDVDYLRPDWGFKWDPRYKSVVVGPKAVLTIYDDPYLQEKMAAFKAGQRIPDLDRQMGVFRSIRSIKVTCS